MESNLPKGWEEISLEKIATFVIGGDWGKDQPETGFERVFVLRGTDYKNWNNERARNSAIRYCKEQSVAKRQLVEGDIVLEVSGGGPDQPVGRVIYIDTKALGSVNGKLSFSNFFRLIRIDSKLNPFFIKAYLDLAYSRGDFNDMQTHTTNLRNLRVSEFLSQTLVPIPPLQEQQRIVAKLDELMEKIDRSRARLERIPKILKRFRQSVLTESFNSDFDEVELSSVCDIDVGYAFKSAEFESKGIRLLRGENIEPGKLRWIDTRFFPKSKLKEFEHLMLNEGDIILAMDRPIISTGLKLAIVKKEDLPCVLVQRVCRFRPHSQLLSSFLHLQLSSQDFIEHLTSKQTGTQIPHISGKQIMSYKIRLPEIQLQREIANKTSNLSILADKIEARYNKAKIQLDKLPQSLLAKAFRGELIPQDLNDEPASVLMRKLMEARDQTLKKGDDFIVKKSETKNTKPRIKISVAKESLIEILRSNQPLSKDELFQRSGLTQHEFLVSLHKYQNNKQIVQLKEKGVTKFRLNANKKTKGK